MLYFAYGSNMSWAQMKDRCPSATFVGVARLPDHRLVFTRKSVKRGCGVAAVKEARGCRVWGVVCRLSELDVGALDKSEGYRPGRQKNSYLRRECMVFVDGDENRPLTVLTYFAEPEDSPPRPNQAYKDLIVEGARQWNLPDDYLRELERIEVDG